MAEVSASSFRFQVSGVSAAAGLKSDQFFKKQLDRINRITGIKQPSAEEPRATGEKNPINLVNPVKKN